MWNENGAASSSSAWSLRDLSWKAFLAAESVFFLAWGIIDLKEVGNEKGDPLLPPIVPAFTFLIIGSYLLLKLIGYHAHPTDHNPSGLNLPSSVWGWTKAVTWLLIFGVSGAMICAGSVGLILFGGLEKQIAAPLLNAPAFVQALILAIVGPHLMLIGAQKEEQPLYCFAFVAFIVGIIVLTFVAFLVDARWLFYSPLAGGAAAILVARRVRKHYHRLHVEDQ